MRKRIVVSLLCTLRIFWIFCKASDAEVCGIINSDMQLRCSEETLQFMLEKAQKSMLIACRIDIDKIDSVTGSMYWGGYDLFLFNRLVAT